MSITIEVDAAALGLRSTSGEAGAQPPHSIRSHSANPTDRFNREINAAFTDSTMKARLLDTGGAVLPGSPAEFGRLMTEETEKWAKVVKFAGIKPN